MAFTIVGCSNKVQTSGSSVKGNKDKPVTATSDTNNNKKNIVLVKKTAKTKYLLSNGIEISNLTKSVTTNYGECSFLFPQISGLVNKSLEQKINKSIISDMENGIKSYTIEINKKPEYMNYTVLLNANNLLSFSLNGLYTPPVNGFLYRLTDGARLNLKDIFTQGTDYVSLINRKVTESIVGGDQDEEDILEKPFETIKPDEDFAFSGSTLYIIFHAGEGGFINIYTAEIPLSGIDDYVNVADLYSGTERKTQENTNLIFRDNNIFIQETGTILQKPNGNVWIHYPQVSGLKDLTFQQSINTTIKEAANEAANDKKIDDLKIVTDWNSDHVAEVEIYTKFNAYGILTLERYVNCGDSSKFQSLSALDKVYSFDLLNKKVININMMLGDYFEKNNELKSKFVDEIKSRFKVQNSDIANHIGSEVDSIFTYSFLMENSTIFFDKYYDPRDMCIDVMFKENSIKGTSGTFHCVVPVSEIIKYPLEDFFGW